MVTIVDTNPHLSVVKECVCKHCGVTLRYVQNDIRRHTETDYTGGKDVYKVITCPSCNKMVYV